MKRKNVLLLVLLTLFIGGWIGSESRQFPEICAMTILFPEITTKAQALMLYSPQGQCPHVQVTDTLTGLAAITAIQSDPGVEIWASELPYDCSAVVTFLEVDSFKPYFACIDK